MTADYRSSVFLPRADFPMRAELPRLEPVLLARWQKMDLYGRLRAQAKGRPKFVLHDGPPYANGPIHIGTALNKVLKDIINRSRQMLGHDAHFVPGWDCHGLPIEWKIEERYRAEGRDKDQVPLLEFRRECREFAQAWVDIQGQEFVRLGVNADWKNAYSTMSFEAEAAIIKECHKFLMAGDLYKGAKPVLWSVVEKTALAEAEVEYYDRVSPSIFVRFPVVGSPQPELGGASIVIWTTTPWTLPGNRAIAVKADADYFVIAVTKSALRPSPPGAPAMIREGEKLVVAVELAASFQMAVGIERSEELARFRGGDLLGTACAHPLRGQGYDFDVPVLAGDFVTLEEGTGFVHIAPGHGTDDFLLGQAHKLEVPETVNADGAFSEALPLFAGKRVFDSEGRDGDADEAVLKALGEAGMLLGWRKLSHAYPHSWRSKAPLIFRTTPQWFISMEVNGLRVKALSAIAGVRWVPPQGETRIREMVSARPDWVVSRQRAWGVPIAAFLDKKTGQPLRDANVNARIVAACAREGADAWFASPPERFLKPDYRAEDYEPVRDILDVWFDSGSTHAFVLEARTDLAWPADLYLEGSDQHRGWFQSSLLESCGTRGSAPYKTVLTHGFVVDEQGRKMSKSLGNVVAPQAIVDAHGADILRLWAMASDFTEDLRIGPDILQAQVDAYRRLRNTLRFLLGNLADFRESERLERDQMPELERFVLHRLAELDRLVRKAVENFDFHRLFVVLYTFCTVDLSAFYFDIRKDTLYCDKASAQQRRAARTALDQLFSCLTAWLAPILCFTAEEAWLCRHKADEDSVHLRTYPVIPADWHDAPLAAKWQRLRQIRQVVTGALEIERASKRIGSSLQAHPVVFAGPEDLKILHSVDFAEVCITSGLSASADAAPDHAYRLPEVAGVAVIAARAQGHKCQRCWRVLEEVGKARPADLCGRCIDAIADRAA